MMPSAEVNSVMIRPHPPRFRMKRRKTVSVTPAIGASTVAGAMMTLPIERLAGTGFCGAGSRAKPAPSTGSGQALSLSKGVPAPHELSQNFFTVLFYRAAQNEAPAAARADFQVMRGESS